MNDNTTNTTEVDSEQALTGQCFCGKAAFSITQVRTVYLCHSHQSQQFSGTAFTATAVVDGASFRWIKGAGFVKRFRDAASDVSQAFCMNCGSPMPIESVDGAQVKVPLGALDKDSAALNELTIECNCFWAERAPWLEKSADAPKHDEL